jgi:hypothetical protein
MKYLRVGIASCFTSIKLLGIIFVEIIFHIDCTHKIIKNYYPIPVFGITDINQLFHPITVKITSHETTEDFVWLFYSLNDLLYEVYS